LCRLALNFASKLNKFGGFAVSDPEFLPSRGEGSPSRRHLGKPPLPSAPGLKETLRPGRRAFLCNARPSMVLFPSEALAVFWMLQLRVRKHFIPSCSLLRGRGPPKARPRGQISFSYTVPTARFCVRHADLVIFYCSFWRPPLVHLPFV